jgi:hypothetical protein
MDWAYASYVLLGCATLAPWNALITAADYWEARYTVSQRLGQRVGRTLVCAQRTDPMPHPGLVSVRRARLPRCWLGETAATANTASCALFIELPSKRTGLQERRQYVDDSVAAGGGTWCCCYCCLLVLLLLPLLHTRGIFRCGEILHCRGCPA